MKLVIGPEVLKSYKRLPYKVWYAFAEFIDNSTQAYQNNRIYMDQRLRNEGKLLEVDIICDNSTIIITDNSVGMSLDEVKKALTIGSVPAIHSGRSRYGMGLKTASFWFGNRWKLTTKKIDTLDEIGVIVDLDAIVDGYSRSEAITSIEAREEFLNNLVPATIQKVADSNLHYTKLEITQLNRRFTKSVQENTKENLRSIYRYDLMHGSLILKYNGEILTWSKDEFKGRLRKDSQGTPYYKEFEFMVNGKKVKGWAGVLKKGSRKDAGFSLLQNNRVIQGWPKGYKPKSVYGDIEGGQNNLVNQRLIGELHLEEFPVSHTKDEFLFDSVEEEELDSVLNEFLADYKRVASQPTKDQTAKEGSEIDFEPIVSTLLEQLKNTTFRAYVHEYPVIDRVELEATNKIVVRNAVQESPYTNYQASVGDLTINVLINEASSPYDPYLILDYVVKPNHVYIILNKKHPHWEELTDHYSIARFIRDCIYDGIAEWKAFKTGQQLQPDTIKSIKDLYMRFKMSFD